MGTGHDEVAASATGPRAMSKSAFPRYRDWGDDEAEESFHFCYLEFSDRSVLRIAMSILPSIL